VDRLAKLLNILDASKRPALALIPALVAAYFIKLVWIYDSSQLKFEALLVTLFLIFLLRRARGLWLYAAISFVAVSRLFIGDCGATSCAQEEWRNFVSPGSASICNSHRFADELAFSVFQSFAGAGKILVLLGLLVLASIGFLKAAGTLIYIFSGSRDSGPSASFRTLIGRTAISIILGLTAIMIDLTLNMFAAVPYFGIGGNPCSGIDFYSGRFQSGVFFVVLWTIVLLLIGRDLYRPETPEPTKVALG
jgi:hypothetical protein